MELNHRHKVFCLKWGGVQSKKQELKNNSNNSGMKQQCCKEDLGLMLGGKT